MGTVFGPVYPPSNNRQQCPFCYILASVKCVKKYISLVQFLFPDN